jgi:DNA polymerase-3 subunit chi
VQVSFYHLTRTPLEKALPKLLEKVLQKEGRAVVLTLPDKVKALNDSLWTFRPDGFLPHGTLDDDGDPMDHPLWLTATLENPNKSQYLVVDGAAEFPLESGFSHCLYLFDSHQGDQLDKARAVWRTLSKEAQHTLQYWKQDLKGAWVKEEL